MNRYPLLYPYARFRDDDDAYQVSKQRKIDAEAEAERCEKHADGRIFILSEDAEENERQQQQVNDDER